MEAMDALQEAAVLVPLYRRGDGLLMLVLVRRSDWGIHGGQIAFPGGTEAPGDDRPADTALREAHEEIGLTRDRVEILEALPVVETRTTGFRISPFLAWIDRPARWRRHRLEIAEILEVPVEDLARPEVHGVGVEDLVDIPEAGRLPYFRVGPHKIWGATYRILHPLLPRLLAEEWPV